MDGNSAEAPPMMRKLVVILAAASMAFGTVAAAKDLGPAGERKPMDGPRMLGHWHEIAMDMSGLDHTPVAPGEDRTFGEQVGPGRASRAMAMVYIAMFDVVNAFEGRYQGYTGLDRVGRVTSVEAAI